jgi:hypothetical protein
MSYSIVNAHELYRTNDLCEEDENFKLFQDELIKYGVEYKRISDDGSISIINYFSVDPYGNINYSYIDVLNKSNINYNNEGSSETGKMRSTTQCGICGGKYFSITSSSKKEYYGSYGHTMNEVLVHFDYIYKTSIYTQKVCTTCGNKYSFLTDEILSTTCPFYPISVSSIS